MNESYRSSAVLTADLPPEEEEDRPPSPPPSDERFCILIAGDFGGGTRAGIRRPLAVDRDNLEEVLAAIRPELAFFQTALSFSELDDFHPDHIFRNCDLFRRLEREALEENPAPRQTTSAPAAPASTAGLLDQILDLSDDTPRKPEFTGDLHEFIRQVTAPHLVAKEDPTQKGRLSRVNAIHTAAMRAILHHPRFQSLEALWRAVAWLVYRLDTDGDLRIYILDIPIDQLASDPAQAKRLLSGPGHRWGAIVLNHVFGQTADDAGALGALGRIAKEIGAPLLAEAAAPDQASEEWSVLRKSDTARWIGLALPRFLLRLPYGQTTSPVEQFPFEEMQGSVHQDYLWGNPAFCCAFLLGRAFLDSGWNMRPGSHRNIEGLPLHLYMEKGEKALKPCAEILLTEHDAEYLLENGVMPLASMKNRDEALLVRFQSIADPPAPLSGGWE